MFRVGVPHSVGIVQIGDQITVSADGHLLTQFTDTQQAYLTGAFGLYSEDAQARFGHIRLAPASRLAAGAPLAVAGPPSYAHIARKEPEESDGPRHAAPAETVHPLACPPRAGSWSSTAHGPRR